MFLENFFENPSFSHKKESPTLTGGGYEETHIELVAGGIATVYDYKPNPEFRKSDIPLIFAPGCGGDQELYYEDMRYLVENFGRRVITLNHPAHQKRKHKIWGEAQSKGLELKAHNIFDVIKTKGLQKVDAVAHSEGAINLITAAARDPERFRNIVLIAPAGLIGKDSLINLAIRFAKNFFAERPETLSSFPVEEQEKNLSSLSSKIERVKHCVYENLFRVLSEIQGIVKSDIRDQLEKLKEAGVNIVIVAAVDDKVFPIERIQKMVKANIIKGFLVIRGGHGDITRIPHFMNIIGSTFETLEENNGSESLPASSAGVGE
jgi:pimeloyl-ACP methyl ester carboxylesterase